MCEFIDYLENCLDVAVDSLYKCLLSVVGQETIDCINKKLFEWFIRTPM